MALLVSTLISDARSATFGAKGRQKVSNAALVQELSYQDQILTQLASQIAPDLLARTTGTVAVLSDAGNQNGYTLEAAIHYRDFTHVDEQRERYTPISILQRQHRDVHPAAPAAMVRTGARNAVLAPIDPQGKRWSGDEERSWFNPGEHTITYSYVPLPGRITSLTDELVTPDMARSVILPSLELVILMNNPEGNAARIEMALARRQVALQTYQFQLYKFTAPQGQRHHERAGSSDSGWVNNQVGG
jgi:hypothetical protein